MGGWVINETVEIIVAPKITAIIVAPKRFFLNLSTYNVTLRNRIKDYRLECVFYKLEHLLLLYF